MGTRHIIKVLKNGKTWISQYGQWDGYPTGQGEDIIEFLSDRNDVDSLAGKIDRGEIHLLTKEEYNEQIQKLVDFIKNAEPLRSMFYQMFSVSVFSRDAGSKCLPMLIRTLGDAYCVLSEPSGWEEYMYTIDLDADTLKIEELSRNGRSVTYDIGGFSSMTEDDIHELMQGLEDEWKVKE